MKNKTTLIQMCLGTILFGIVSQLIFVWFVDKKGYFSLGLWLGIIVAILGAIHMQWSLEKALDMGEGGSVKKMVLHNMLRYFCLIAFLGVLMITDFANPLSAFLGVMGMKAGAYLQPLVSKGWDKICHRGKEENLD